MSDTSSSLNTRVKVGIFAVVGLLLIGLVTVLVNDKPYWWRGCQAVRISVEDATGLKTKSPIRSLGLEIGYLSGVELAETHVMLAICITAPVEVLPTTRAYLRSEGFLGDKFVELKPVKFLGTSTIAPGKPPVTIPSPSDGTSLLWDWLVPNANAEPTVADEKKSREIPVAEGSQDMQKVMTKVGDLVTEMGKLTTGLKQAFNPEEMRETMHQLNHALENASKTLAPEGGMNQTARRTLSKLEDSIEQLRDQMTRINQGKGSLGMLLNDPIYAEEIKKLIENANKLLNRVGSIRFVMDIGGQEINGYNAGRGYFKLHIYPSPDRYYLLGGSVDPRGARTFVTTTTVVGGQSQVTTTETINQTALQITAMFGKILLNRLDLSVGAQNGDGAVSVALYLGPSGGDEDRFQLIDDLYSHGGSIGVNNRITLQARPFGGVMNSVYVNGGIESFAQVNGNIAYFYGAGLSFTDDDVKLLFTLK